MPTRRRKVFILGNSAAEIYSSRAPLIKELVSQDFDVVCTSQPADVRAECHLAALGARCVILPPTRPGLSPFRDARTFWSLFGVLRRERPDVVLSFGLKPNVFGALAARLAGVDRRIAMVDGLRFTYTGGREWKHRIARIGFDFLYSFPCALSDALIVQNRDDRAFFVKHFMQRSAHRIHVMPGVGVDLDAYRPVPLPEGPLTLVMVSRLSRDKGV
ncbi:MAG: glycosyltransferase, partial [Alphaproteobacteria bacterium]|nr:glycosyltransferase [Alphaproteobacteria bacterium]